MNLLQWRLMTDRGHGVSYSMATLYRCLLVVLCLCRLKFLLKLTNCKARAAARQVLAPFCEMVRSLIDAYLCTLSQHQLAHRFLRSDSHNKSQTNAATSSRPRRSEYHGSWSDQLNQDDAISLVDICTRCQRLRLEANVFLAARKYVEATRIYKEAIWS